MLLRSEINIFGGKKAGSFYSISIALCYSLKTVERFDELFEEDIVPTFINEVLIYNFKVEAKGTLENCSKRVIKWGNLLSGRKVNW